MRHRWTRIWCIAALLIAGTASADPPSPSSADSVAPNRADFLRVIQANCLSCHDDSAPAGELNLQDLLGDDVARHTEVWERAVRKIASGQMPPRTASQPSQADRRETLAWLASALDAAAEAAPNPGRTETFRRLNRTEYRNTIRDLLGLDVDVAALLPPDESSHGFDNVTVADLSPTLLVRSLSAAQKISRLAVGTRSADPDAVMVRVRPDVTQDSHVAGLPLGTRGGVLVPHHFPRAGEYEVQVHLMRDRNDDIESLREPHTLVVLVDRSEVKRIVVRPVSSAAGGQDLAADLTFRLPIAAGRHEVGVTFVQKGSSLLETKRQPLDVHFNFYRHPRLGPALYDVAIVGPIGASQPGDTASRRQIFGVRPADLRGEEGARQVLAPLVRRAYRRPLHDGDLDVPLQFFRDGEAEGGFDAGIELALSSILVNPQFLFRIERDPPAAPVGTVSSISGPELASRLSYFLWSSQPDDELLDLAERDELQRPDVLERQVRRLLADPRSRSLVENFAGQWLYLRNLDAATPDMRLFPDFDDNLRQAMQRETELLVERVLRDDRSVLELIRSDSTFLNERLARHYGIPHVVGSRFRSVTLAPDDHRGGLLRHGSILTVTSYATRTSPVVRGQWVLKNLIGTPIPPPPPDVPALAENTVSNRLPIRERLRQHRADENCAGCHNQMDPVGFSLEQFDAIGRWREFDGGDRVDASGGFPDGSTFDGVTGLEMAVLRRPELFVQTLAEKLLTFALGRGVETYDAPAIRQIVRGAAAEDYRFSRLILEIARSLPFQKRRTS